MSKYKKLVLDGRVVLIPKDRPILGTHMKKQGFKNTDDYIQDKVRALQLKYGGNCGFIV